MPTLLVAQVEFLSFVPRVTLAAVAVDLRLQRRPLDRSRSPGKRVPWSEVGASKSVITEMLPHMLRHACG